MTGCIVALMPETVDAFFLIFIFTIFCKVENHAGATNGGFIFIGAINGNMMVPITVKTLDRINIILVTNNQSMIGIDCCLLFNSCPVFIGCPYLSSLV